jgi:hypothetical protein
MLPFIAAGVVALGATALAWYFDRETDEERRTHATLRSRNAGLREQFAATREASARERAVARKQAALAVAGNLRDYCNRYRNRTQAPAQEFRKLAGNLEVDLKDTSISPYRRNALKLLQGRLEDTRNRLDAYQCYCDWYIAQVDSFVAREDYDALLSFGEPAVRLPEDFFYNGKVGLASVTELNRSRNAYGQGLELVAEKQSEAYSDSKQRAFMLQYPDQEAIPVQLRASNNPRFFKACILKGALHVEHILEKLPCTAFVTRARTDSARGDGYDVRCFPSFCSVDKQHAANSGVAAFLPRSESSFPGKRYIAGEKIEVYLHHYDLLLSGTSLTVTQQRESLELASRSVAPVFINANGGVHDLHPLLEEMRAHGALQLRSFVELEKGAAITLQLGAWQLETEASKEDSQLRLVAATRTGIDSVKLEQLPYPVRLIDEKYKDNVFSDVLQFHEFLQFCRQQALFGADEEDRKAAGAFFERWSRVTDFLLDEEGYHIFDLTPTAEPDEREWDCACAVTLTDALQRLIDQSFYTPRLYLEEEYVGRNGERRWLQVGELQGVPEALGHGIFRLSHSGIKRPGLENGYRLAEPSQLRLRFPNGGELANLGRQKRALNAFMSGRLINRALQQILLMPQRYAGAPDPTWEERVRAGLKWQHPKWQEPEAALPSKHVIEAALTESNLYLIQGPPGTGKTTCIVEMLYQLLDANPATRILVVSQQNTAVDNALERFLDRYPAYGEQILRISNDATKVHANLRRNVTETILTDYLAGRQREYSRASIDLPARAAWIKDWMDRIYNTDGQGRRNFDDELTELLVGGYGLVGATCVGLASRRYGMDRLEFDVCIIDEGGRSTVPELLIPLMRSRKAILIGDHYQLPPSVASRLREEDVKETLPFLEETFLKTSFFEQLYENLPNSCRGRLTQQFRMVEPIGDLVADLFYTENGQRGLFNGEVHDRSGFLDPAFPLRWHNVDRGRQEKENGTGPSLLNAGEADAILHFLEVARRRLNQCHEQQGDDFEKKTVAIITPYGGQKRLIRKLLERWRAKSPDVDKLIDVEVDTVDSFQGSEADIVLYSTVRTHGDLSFLLDRQRLNVACSRARENLVFFGSASFLKQREARMGTALFSHIIDRSKYQHQALAQGEPVGVAQDPRAGRRPRVRP